MGGWGVSHRSELSDRLVLKRHNIAPDISEALSRIVLEYLETQGAEILRLRGLIEEQAIKSSRLNETCAGARREGVEQAFREGFNAGWEAGYKTSSHEEAGYRALDLPTEDEAWEQSEAAASIRPIPEDHFEHAKFIQEKECATPLLGSPQENARP